MRQIRGVLRLYFAAASSVRAVPRSLGVSPSTVGDYLCRAEVAGLEWPLRDSGRRREVGTAGVPAPPPPPPPPPSGTSRPLPAWSEVHKKLRRKRVTLSLSGGSTRRPTRRGWNSAVSASSTGPGRKLDVVMRQEHRAGERMFVDYAGQTVPVVDPETGELRQAPQVFVAVLGASSYTFAEAP